MEKKSLVENKLNKLFQEYYKYEENLFYRKIVKLGQNEAGWKNGCSKILLYFVMSAFLSLPPVYGQQPPPNYNYKMLPETSFTCEDKATGGYYADPEAGCQMFHVCLRVSEEQINDFKFLCPNNTVFDQQNFICTNWWEIDCQHSTRYFNKNDLFKITKTTTAEPKLEEQTGYHVDTAKLPKKNETAKKLPKASHRLKQVQNYELTTTRFEKTNFAYSNTTLPPSTTISERFVSREQTTPKITTYRSRHRFSFQSEDNIGRRAYQPVNEKKEQSDVVLNASNRRRESVKIPKSLDQKNETRVLQHRKRKKTNKDRSSQTDSNSRVNKETTHNINRTQNCTEHKACSNSPRVKALRRRTNRRQKSTASKPKEKHKEFSNFRFYKTAFGRSYSSDDFLHTTTPRNGKRRAKFRRPRRLRNGRIAYRNTRYSKYAS